MFVGACQNTKASYQQWRANVQAKRSMEVNAKELRQGIKGIAQARFGQQGAQNLQFGFSLPKPRKKSAETKAVAVAKSAATRKQRNTMGSVQKKDVKGNVDVALVVTPSGGPSPTDSAANGAGAAPTGAQGAPPVVVPTNGASAAPVPPAVAPAPAAAPAGPSATSNGH